MEILHFDNVAFPVDARSDALKAKDRDEENLMWAMEALERIRRLPVPSDWQARRGFSTWQQVLMHTWKAVAAHYEVCPDDLLALWSRHYGIGLVIDEMEKGT